MTIQGARSLADSRGDALALVEEAAGAVESGRGGRTELAVIVSNLDVIWGSVERDQACKRLRSTFSRRLPL